MQDDTDLRAGNVENYGMAPALNQLLKFWESQKKSIEFSEESSRTIHALGNIELHELGEISRAVQCHSDFLRLRHCLRLDEEQIQRFKARFEAMIVPFLLCASQ